MSFFKDKVIWITGASSGIGEALALELAKQGGRLILSARREDELKRVAALTKLPDLDIMLLPFDLKDTSKATALAASILNKFGRIDILVNNGGMSQRAEAEKTTIDIDRELMEINYFAYVNLTKAVLPYMKRQKSGHVIVISSIAGKFGFYLRSGYSAAKHALHGFFDSFRLETEKDGIKTLIVCPGKIKTNISLNAVTDKGAHGKMDPSHENAMSAEECARIILKGIQNNDEEILVGGKELLAVKIKRFFPKWFGRIIRKQSPF
ncbi:MAG: SDR family oxidoreductase [Bacteroidia bacterium]|jgi:dehydrogenase/reductase SDR family member 7B|nr:SDR family oxidoreductase [Sphingobacteriaceae bacterium]MBK7310418.1 SDR family oxidoreductase [Sphingobacteriaceae bacterium]MBP9070163.1 SDR family oxidoreductase [Bacteroidia bacterium]